MIAHALALIKNRYFDGNLDANTIATTALYHDASEVITGDLPTPIKYHSPAILQAYKQVEQQAELELLNLLPPALQTDYQSLLLHQQIPASHQQIIKAADRIAAYLKCQSELKAGNGEFEIAAQRIAQEIQDSDQAEVVFFMTHFVPSCGLTLDDLMAKAPSNQPSID